MPGTKGQLFIVNERQRYWWRVAEEDRRADERRADAKPVLTRPQRLDQHRGNRLAVILRLIIRPAAG
jgi:hypothetical protein